MDVTAMKNSIKIITLALLAALSFSCRDFLNEEALENYIKVTPASIEADCEEKIVNITVEANCQWSIKKTDSNGDATDWFKVNAGKTDGSVDFSIKVLANPTGEPRRGAVELVAENASAFIVISQEANPYPPDEEPELSIDPLPFYRIPTYQVFNSDCTVEGNLVKFGSGLMIEKTGAGGAPETDFSNELFPAVLGSNFSDGDCWIYRIPMKKEFSGSLRFTYGSNDNNTNAAAHSWSTDEGKSWNPVTEVKPAVSHSSLKSVYFIIPADKKIRQEKYLWIRIDPTEASSVLQNGITLDNTDAVSLSDIPAQNSSNVVISEGFDGIRDANGAMLEVTGFMKYMTSGKTADGEDSGLLEVENKAISFLHASARPGFAQIGYNDPVTGGGWKGEMRIKVGERLKEMGIEKTNLKLSFKAAGLTTGTKIAIMSAGSVAAKVNRELSDKEWSSHPLYVTDADQNSELVVTSEEAHSFFIDDLVIETARPFAVLNFPFRFTAPGDLDKWPNSEEKHAREKEPREYEYVYEGASTATFTLDEASTNVGSKMESGLYATTGNPKYWYLRLNHSKKGYLGLPVVEGKKLIKVELGSARSSGESKIGITSKIYDKNASIEYIEGGEPVYVNNDKVPTVYDLIETEADTRYYLVSAGTAWVGINNIILTYE